MGKLRNQGKKPSGTKRSSNSRISKRSVVKTDIYDEGDTELTGKQRLRANATDKYSQSMMQKMRFDNDDEEVLHGDDESIDSDGGSIGWNSDDDAAYGGMLDKKNKKKDLSEEEDYDDDNEGGTLLSDMLSGTRSSAVSKKDQPKGSAALEDIFDGSDDDDSDEDDASDYDSDGHTGLLSAVDKFTKTPDESSDNKGRISRESQFAPESQFSVSDPSKLSISTLLGALSSDSRGLSAVKTKLADLEKTSSAPKAIEKVVSERVERAVAYDASKADMNKWQATVVENRNAKSLDLAGDKRQLPSYKGLIDKFEASNDLERDIDMVLVESNGYEGNALELEEDALKARHATPEQMKESMGELAKIRALMFYEQMKRHRINKIKSKAYHRIRNRKNKRDKKNQDSDSSDALSDPEADQDAEHAATARVKERMNLKHQNTTKWARMAQQYGKGNKELRMAYHESVQLGHDLARKVDRTKDNDSDNGLESSSDVEGGDATSRLKKQLQGIVAGDGAFDDSNDAEANSKYKKLFDMDFMKKSKARQQDKAREEAASLLREIEEMEQSDNGNDSDSENVVSKPKQSAAEKKLVDKERQALARQQMETLFSAPKGRSTDNGKSTKVSKAAETAPEDFTSNPWLSGINQIDRVLDGKAAGTVKASKKKSTGAAGNIKVSVPAVGEEIVTFPKKYDRSDYATIDTKPKSIVITMSGKKVRAVAVTPTIAPKPVPAEATALTINKNESKKQILLQRSQDELVKEAFAGPDYEAEFQAGKKQAIDAELDIDVKKQKIMTAGRRSVFFLLSVVSFSILAYEEVLKSPSFD